MGMGHMHRVDGLERNVRVLQLAQNPVAAAGIDQEMMPLPVVDSETGVVTAGGQRVAGPQNNQLFHDGLLSMR